jgi:hypothetical protein
MAGNSDIRGSSGWVRGLSMVRKNAELEPFRILAFIRITLDAFRALTRNH